MIRCGGDKSVFFGVQNDGSGTDSFTIRATPGNELFNVKYIHGKTNVTRRAVNGTLHTGELAPGAIFVVRAEFYAVTQQAGKTREFSIRAGSPVYPGESDLVKIQVTSIKVGSE